MKIRNFANIVKDKCVTTCLNESTYISTDNMLPHYGGVVPANIVPSGKATQFRQEDILLSNIRPYFRKTWYASFDGGCSADVLCIRADKAQCHPHYLYYQLASDNFVKDYLKSCKGAKMPRGDENRLLDYEIALPPIPEQLRIASILGNLDERIEICRKKIALIRSFIERLYDYWFVQFKFPGHECSDMMWNDKAKKNIPQHWTVGVLSDCADVTMGQSPDGASYNVDRNGILFFQGATDFGEVFPSERQYTTSPTRYARGGDILLSVRAPVGTMNVAMKDCCIGRGLAAIRGKCCCNSFIEISLKKFAAVFARKNGDGTTFGAITKDELFGLPVIIPEKKILSSFGEIAIPLEKEITVEACKMSKLIEQRDWLLPMLMNGQVVVE